jgi:hypothetical protein
VPGPAGPKGVAIALVTVGGGGWFGPVYGGALSTGAVTAGNGYAGFISLATATPFTHVAVNVTGVGVAGSTVRFGLYTHAPNVGPVDRVRDWGTATLTTTGLREVVIVDTVPAGDYWIVANPSANCSLSCYGTVSQPSYLGTTSSFTALVTGITCGGVMGSPLPATYPSPTPVSISFPRIAFRID